VGIRQVTAWRSLDDEKSRRMNQIIT